MIIKNIICKLLKYQLYIFNFFICGLKKLVTKICSKFISFLCFFYSLPKSPTVVVYMDGGFSSQMFEYALGELFKRNGYLVLYDLSWFKISKKNKNNPRFFELKKLYPHLELRKASIIISEKFRRLCSKTSYDIEKCIKNKQNLYLVNDHLTYPIGKMNELFQELYSNPEPVLDEKNSKMANIITNDYFSCAVHVRRGDLTDQKIAFNSGYGTCVTEQYYINAIQLMVKLIPNVKFYFFSDELLYIKNELIPLLGNINYSIVDINIETVHKGGVYKDFYLILQCKNQICSLGSFGIEAAKLNKNQNKIVITKRKIYSNIKNLIELDENGLLINSSISTNFIYS